MISSIRIHTTFNIPSNSSQACCITVLLKKNLTENLTENAFGTRLERVPKCVKLCED